MTNLETYLKNATRGIWGKRKLEIREELQADILERTRKHEISGLTRESATARAIQELGDARVLNRGMTGVYMMPAFFKTAVAAVMISMALIFTVQPSIAQVTSTTRLPIPQCLESKSSMFDMTFQGKTVSTSCEFGQLWISLSSLKKVLQPLNVKVLEYPDAPYRDVHLKFPEGYTAKFHLDWGRLEFPDQKFVLNPDYVSANALIDAISLTPLNVRITGWENPRISVGKTTFTLTGIDSTIRASALYQSMLYENLGYFFPTDFALEPIWLPSIDWFFDQNSKDTKYMHKIRYNAEPGTILVILSREPAQGWMYMEGTQWKTGRQAFFAVVGQDGTLEYISRAKTLKFDGKINKLKPIVVGGEASLTVLRVTGDFSFNSKEQFQTIKSGALSLESSQKR